MTAGAAWQPRLDLFDSVKVEEPLHLGLVHRVGQLRLAADLGEVHQGSGNGGGRDAVYFGAVLRFQAPGAMQDEAPCGRPWSGGR